MTLPLRPIIAPDSIFSRFDPRWKLVSLILLETSLSLLRSLPAVATGFGLSILLVGLARLPAKWYAARVLALMVSLSPFLLLIPFAVQRIGLEVALSLTLKSVSLLSVGLVLLGTAPLHRTLRAASALGCPRLLIQLANLTYRYLFVFAQEFQRIRTALRVRGFHNRPTRHAYRTVAGVVGTLLVRSADRAERVAQAMRCRGFDGSVRSMEEFRTGWRDVLLTLALIGSTAGLLVWDRVG